MAGDAPFELPPTAVDRAAARASAAIASRPQQRLLRMFTCIADEKPILAATAALWLASRCSRRQALRREADQLLAVTLVAAAAPHLVKRLVRRRRPDRTFGRHPRKGIELSGDAWDSFPSGHAVHVGAVARLATGMTPPRWRPLLWSGFVSLLASRVLVLAHYPSDVLAGLTLGVGIDRAVAAIFAARDSGEPGADEKRPA